jgi:hypothetical protein
MPLSKDQELLLALRRALQNGQSSNVRTVFLSLPPTRQLALAEMEIETLANADESTFDQASKMLMLATPLLQGHTRVAVRERLVDLKERTPYKEILRCLISILWKMEINNPNGSTGTSLVDGNFKGSGNTALSLLEVPLRWA